MDPTTDASPASTIRRAASHKMPTLTVAEASNAAFSPSYLPVAVFGGTSEILAGFPKPAEPDGWAHEFVLCDASRIAHVRAVYAGLRPRLEYVNLLAAGPASNSVVASSVTPEGLDAPRYAVRGYFMRYVFTQALLPLLARAREKRQHAHMMSVTE
ncbi:hypothetical protein DFH07DRAFT_1062785 [Mycena maculata]|uniref:Uncharacterized protein n=1 Tax=Mycena maculata TaxID=230809 RepID=A0AAD7N647_9AGAR|nr:hypothetical protein DFH07DRAFT_1062785 [Mycena maculata]